VGTQNLVRPQFSLTLTRGLSVNSYFVVSKKQRMRIRKHKHKPTGFFERFANWSTHFTGSSPAFMIALGIVIVWAATGPIFDYSETWQLVINTGTTIITFLMVFLIQKAQNKDSKAIHLKLNELLAAQDGASNRMVDLEDLSEEELDQIHKFYAHLARLAKQDTDIPSRIPIFCARTRSTRQRM
jgi:low affinity Fe/Cu permease